MSKSDLEMEDAEKLSRELGGNVRDAECESVVSDVASKGETGLSEADTEVNANKKENEGKDVNNVNETQCEPVVESKGETVLAEADMQGNANKNENEGKDVNNVNETQFEPVVESKGEAVLPEADIQGNANKEENGGRDVNTVTDDANDKVTLKSEVEDQSQPSGEAVEPMVDVTSVAEPVNDTSENVSLILPETNRDESTDGGSTVQEQTDTGNEHDKQSTMDIDKGLEKENHVNDIEKQTETENPQQSISQSLESGNHLEDAEGKPSADIVDKVSEEIKKPDQDSVEHLAREESTMETDDAGNEPSVKSLLPADISDNKAAENEKLLPDDISENKAAENERLLPADISDNKGAENERLLPADISDNKGAENERLLPADISDNKGAENERLLPADISDNKGAENERLLPADVSDSKAAENESRLPDEIPLIDNKESENAADSDEKKAVIDEIEEPGNEMSFSSPVINKKAYAIESETSAKHGNDDSSRPTQQEHVTRSSRVRYSPSKNGNQPTHAVKTVFTQAALPLMAESDDGTPEEQAAFMKELEAFYREKGMDFKPPKFYGKPLNCLKLWRSVIRLGCYDRVTGSKLWRQVGESFHPPKTCTTVSFTFRVFYEKSLLEFERHKKQRGELQLPLTALHDESGVENEGYGNNQGSGSVTGRARRDAAARAMQGWHVQRVIDNGEAGQPILKDKYPNDTAKRDKNLRGIGPIKQKRPNEVENSIKVARTDAYNQLETTVIDIGPPADWVKINIRQTKDCFEVYALVPGLLREEVRVQSDPAGRLVITGHPEQLDNPWGITPFKKVVSLPARIDPLQTSAIVSLHGRLFIRVPFEQSNV